MDTPGVRDTLIAVLPLPPIQTPALSRRLTGSVFSATALLTDRGAAIRAGPALQARLVAVVVTVKVAEEVVSRPAEFVAAEAVVVVVAADADLVLELGHDAVVLQSLPLSARVDHPRLHGPLDHLTAATASARVVVEVQGLHDHCV